MLYLSLNLIMNLVAVTLCAECLNLKCCLPFVVMYAAIQQGIFPALHHAVSVHAQFMIVCSHSTTC